MEFQEIKFHDTHIRSLRFFSMDFFLFISLFVVHFHVLFVQLCNDNDNKHVSVDVDAFRIQNICRM